MKFKNFLKNIVKKADDIIVNMDGGVGGSWKVNEEVVEEAPPACTVKPEEPYTGIPAPAYLSEDPWFPSPIRSQKQLDYMEQETEIKRQEREENFSVEPEDIHQKLYEVATGNQSTTLHLDPPGGSENFQEGGWNSGTGMGQFR